MRVMLQINGDYLMGTRISSSNVHSNVLPYVVSGCFTVRGTILHYSRLTTECRLVFNHKLITTFIAIHPPILSSRSLAWYSHDKMATFGNMGYDFTSESHVSDNKNSFNIKYHFGKTFLFPKC